MYLLVAIPAGLFLCGLGIMMRNEAKVMKRNDAASDPMFSGKRR